MDHINRHYCTTTNLEPCVDIVNLFGHNRERDREQADFLPRFLLFMSAYSVVSAVFTVTVKEGDFMVSRLESVQI